MVTQELSNADRAELTRLEEAMWQQATRFALKFQASRFAEDFFEFGRSGRVYERHQIILQSENAIEAKIPLPDLNIRLLDINTAQITYNSLVVHEGIVNHSRRSSIWSRTVEGWVMRFHQGTPYVPDTTK